MKSENYHISFEEAREKDYYKFSLKEINKLKEYKVLFNEVSENDECYYGGLEVLEFGNIDIELNVTKSVSEKNVLDFFICIKRKEGWESYDFSDYILKYEDLKDIETLERVMYRELMIFAEKHNLYWSGLN